jgi:exodeoxyribonuclease V alpha subunit
VKYVEGFVENIIFRNEDNGYTVFNIVYDDEEITCVGVLSYINTGEFITAQGEFVKHAVYYMQFKVTSYEFRAPDDAASVRRYLSSGAIKGIGEKMAERIVKTFGDDTFRIMEEEPERLAEIKGISMSKAMDIANQLIDKKDIRKAMMFLQRYGIQMNLANKIFKRYGNDIYNILEQNPYRLADERVSVLGRLMRLLRVPESRLILNSGLRAEYFMCLTRRQCRDTHIFRMISLCVRSTNCF